MPRTSSGVKHDLASVIHGEPTLRLEEAQLILAPITAPKVGIRSRLAGLAPLAFIDMHGRRLVARTAGALQYRQRLNTYTLVTSVQRLNICALVIGAKHRLTIMKMSVPLGIRYPRTSVSRTATRELAITVFEQRKSSSTVASRYGISVRMISCAEGGVFFSTLCGKALRSSSRNFVCTSGFKVRYLTIHWAVVSVVSYAS